MASSTVSNCSKIFVSWVWFCSILIVMLGGVGGISWSFASRESAQNQGIKENRRELQDVKRVQEVIQTRLIADMDTLKSEIRKQGR